MWTSLAGRNPGRDWRCGVLQEMQQATESLTQAMSTKIGIRTSW
jgi:hypothetical protein